MTTSRARWTVIHLFKNKVSAQSRRHPCSRFCAGTHVNPTILDPGKKPNHRPSSSFRHGLPPCTDFRKLSYFTSMDECAPSNANQPPSNPCRPEHGFLTTSALYGGMCHIVHTCALNSSPLSVYDTPVGLGLNAAAWMNQRPRSFGSSFDPRSPSLAWSRSLACRRSS